MAQLRTLSLQKGELLEARSVLPLRRLLGSMLPRELILKEGDLLCKDLSAFMNRGEHCVILHLRSRYPL
jgi:hypothetical protein